MTDPFATLPEPNEKRIAVSLKPAAERTLKSGHPWIFDGSITRQSHEGDAGDLAVMFDKKRKFIGIGLYDPDSPIRIKVLHQGKPTTIDDAFFNERIATAVQRRQPLLETDTNGYRVIHGENDGFPGLIADRYADTLVIKLYTGAWFPYLRGIVEALRDHLSSERVVLRLSRNLSSEPSKLYGLHDGQFIVGEPIDMPLVFQENGLNFSADVVDGHKTGVFFDHRDNRAQVRKMAKGRTVLDVFAYAGAFSLYAASGGARAVTSVDISAPALESAQDNFALNQHIENVANCKHDIIVADAFDALEDLRKEGKTFEMVIVDPPSFAKSADEIAGALASYERLTALALDVLAPQGVFVMASCSSRVSADEFFKTVLQSADAHGYFLLEQRRTAHAIDHPITFEEGAYLKCLFASLVS